MATDDKCPGCDEESDTDGLCTDCRREDAENGVCSDCGSHATPVEETEEGIDHHYNQFDWWCEECEAFW